MKSLLTLSALVLVTALAGTFSAASAGATAGTAQRVTLNVFRGESGIKGPDGRNHDTFVPAGFVVKAGVPVHLVVINHDEGPHTISPDDMKAGFGPFLVKPGDTEGTDVRATTSTFDFTPPKPGVFRWHCAVTCDGGGNGWAMGHAVVQQGGKVRVAGQPGEDGFMAGYIVVM